MGKLKESEVCKVISQFEFESTDIFLEKVSTTEGKKFIVLDSSKSRKDFIETLRTILLKDSSFVKNMAETRIAAFDDKNIYNQWNKVHEELSKIYIEEYKEYVENVKFIK